MAFLFSAAPAHAGPPPAPGATSPSLGVWRLGGSGSLNWRNVGPREPGFETQIQHEIYLADLYFSFYGPMVDNMPFILEFNMPTGSQGQPSLYRMYFQYDRFSDWSFQAGKFLVPFGRYNELYRPDMFLTVTRPLLYASPDSLDLVVRLNSPRPPFSSGYTDIGARASYYPPFDAFYVPNELTLFLVNGLSESTNRSRTFPTPENLGIPLPPPTGVSIDFGHENNNLADNNNNKAIGGRMVYALGTLDLPWPIPEGKRDLNGTAFGLSGMTGQYNLEGNLAYHMIGVDGTLEYQGINLSAEYMYSYTHFLAPIEATPGGALINPTVFRRDYEEIQGFYVQAAFPLWRRPRWGKRLTGVLVYNRLFRRGPQLDLLTNQVVNGETFSSIGAYNPASERIDRHINKFTGAINYQLTENFIAKFDYSYWGMGHSTTRYLNIPTADQVTIRDIYQGAASLVVSF